MLQRISDIIATLSKPLKFRIALEFAEMLLPVWNKNAEHNELYYIGTVVGMEHTVDRELPKRVMEVVKNELQKPGSQWASIKAIQNEFSDPIVALQDEDWELPNAVQKTFYSFYNLTEALAGNGTTMFGEETIYVSVNQAVDALRQEDLINDDLLKEIMTRYGHRE